MVAIHLLVSIFLTFFAANVFAEGKSDIKGAKMTTEKTSLIAKTTKCNDSENIYKTCSDQKAPFAALVGKAQKEHKVLLITFGADWCPWCRSLHAVMTSANFQKSLATEKLNGKSLASLISFANVGVSQKIDGERQAVVDGREIFAQIAANTKSGEQKIDGMPYLVFYDPANQKAVFRDSGNLESGDGKVNHDPAKIIAAIKESLAKL